MLARMGRILQIAIIATLAAMGYRAYHRAHLAGQPPERASSLSQRGASSSEDLEPERDDSPSDPTGRYQCDGRTRCSQLRSCEEATWAIENCPGMKMDGDNDGVPCEDHLCPHS